MSLDPLGIKVNNMKNKKSKNIWIATHNSANAVRPIFIFDVCTKNLANKIYKTPINISAIIADSLYFLYQPSKEGLL
uniref:Uncharacterized protein n=1 Tax=viral metagenome TaxID=1070528 RepID=A0A6C0HAD3_9ZZZZ